MIAVIQRVSSASVEIAGNTNGAINTGMLILLGIEEADDHEDIQWLVKKILNLRIFPDDDEVMNRSCLDVNGELLVISQFTLHASTKKGNRPSYIKAAKPEISKPLYHKFIEECESYSSSKVATGVFGADMKISLVNDGPVTIVIDTKNKV